MGKININRNDVYKLKRYDHELTVLSMYSDLHLDSSKLISLLHQICSANFFFQIHHDSKLHISGFKRQGDNMADPIQKRRPAFGDITNVWKDNCSL